MTQTRKIRGVLRSFISEPVPFTCPCGRPLELGHLVVSRLNHTDEWVMGHLDCKVSPVVKGKSLKAVAQLALNLLRQFGHWPTMEECQQQKGVMA